MYLLTFISYNNEALLHMKGNLKPTQNCGIQSVQSKRLHKQNIPHYKANKKASLYFSHLHISSMWFEATKRLIEGSFRQTPFREISIIQVT